MEGRDPEKSGLEDLAPKQPNTPVQPSAGDGEKAALATAQQAQDDNDVVQTESRNGNAAGELASGESTSDNTSMTGGSTQPLAPEMHAPGHLTTLQLREHQNEYPDGPPELPFNLRNHKLPLAIFSFLCLAETCFIPLGLYYGLSKGTNMRSGIVFAIITSLFGFVTGYEFGMRGWRLVRKTDEYRPLHGAKKWHFDTSQHVLITPFTVMTILLIIFSIPHYPSIQALALPMPVGMIVSGVMFAISGWATNRGWRLMYFRMSSHVRNSVAPPLTFCCLEDICAVDGKGGKRFRQAAMDRYNTSPRFRKLLMQLLWFWSIPAILLGAGLIVGIYLTHDDIAYALGWGVPNAWAIVWIWLQVLWVQRSLRIEKAMWQTDRMASA